MRNRNKSGGGLMTLLTTLLIVCALAEAGIASYVGVNIQISKQANEEHAARYAAYQEQQAQAKENPPVVQYVGPEVRVVDSAVTQGHWEPVQQSENRQSVYTTSAPSAKIEQPELDLDIDVGKVETPPAASSSQPKASGGTSSPSNSKPADTAKPSTGSSNQSGGVSITPSDGNKSSGGGSGNADNFYAHNNPEQQQTSAQYVLNTNTKKFHIPTCSDVKRIASKNYSTSNDSRDNIINSGYSPCGHCNP